MIIRFNLPYSFCNAHGCKPFQRDSFSFGELCFFVFYFILSRLLYLAFSANLGLLCMSDPGMGPLVCRPFRRTAE